MNITLRIATLLVASTLGTAAHAQRSDPVDNLLQRCVTFKFIVRDTSARGYYSQVIEAKNNCGQTYLYKVCMAGTPHCTQIPAAPGLTQRTMGTSMDNSLFELDSEFLR